MNDSPEPVDLSPSRDELIARVRARGRQIRARRRLGAAGIAVVVAFGIAAPAIAIGTRSSSTSSVPPAGSTTAPPSTVVAQRDLVVTFELPSSTVVAGSELHGTVIITNTTEKPVALDTPGECAGKWAVELTSPTASQHTAWTDECHIGSTRSLPPGANRFPFTISTTYSECTNDATGASQGLRCLSDPPGGIPLLPPGDYDLGIVTSQPGYLPAGPHVPVRIVAAVSRTATDLGDLTLQNGARSTKLLVPAGWTLKIEDGGGSGSGSTWTNPTDKDEQIFGATGVEVGSWWETDGVKGSIKPGSMIPPGAPIDRVNYTTFRYHLGSAAGYDIDGVWIALVTADGPNAYVAATVQLPRELHTTATEIIDRFISDTNAMVPPYPGP